MLTELRVKNFKAWDDERWHNSINLAPVTLFLGTNSSGKTSLLQTLLLLKQTFGSPDRQLALNLGGQKHDLIDFGGYEDVIYRHDTKRALAVGFSIDSNLRYECTYVLAGGVPAIQRLAICEGDAAFSVTRQGKGGYLLAAPGYVPEMLGSRQDARRSFAPERSLAFSPEALAVVGTSAGTAQDVVLRIGKAIEGIAYLGPLRQPPARTYLWSRQAPGRLGDSGEFAVAALLASANARTKPNPDGEFGRGWLVEKVSHWMHALGIADSLDMVQQGRSRFFEVVVKTAGQEANIMDVGFGVSQILPFVVLAHFVPRGTTIIAEEPEIHLHPQVQSGLANLMVEISKSRGVQFLLETHSEHLFRRMQALVAEGTQSRECCRMYFVEPKEGKATLRDLTMDEFGRVKDWPKHFFGDATGEIEKQMRAMLQRHRDASKAPPAPEELKVATCVSPSRTQVTTGPHVKIDAAENPYSETSEYGKIFEFIRSHPEVAIGELEKHGFRRANINVVLSPRGSPGPKGGDVRGNLSAKGHLYYVHRDATGRLTICKRVPAMEPRSRHRDV